MGCSGRMRSRLCGKHERDGDDQLKNPESHQTRRYVNFHRGLVALPDPAKPPQNREGGEDAEPVVPLPASEKVVVAGIGGDAPGEATWAQRSSRAAPASRSRAWFLPAAAAISERCRTRFERRHDRMKQRGEQEQQDRLHVRTIKIATIAARIAAVAMARGWRF